MAYYSIGDEEHRGSPHKCKCCLWQSVVDPNNVFFILDVADVDRANAFMARPESQEMGVKSGVIDGEFHYIEPVPTDR